MPGDEPNYRIDLNGDVGESFGAYSLGNDVALFDYVTSANVACGFHAGDPSVMRRTIRAALEKGVAIGAHPGYPDLQGFGRRPMDLSADEAYALTLYQIGALYAFARAEGGELSHVKPHGALYNRAAKDPSLADAIARAILDFDPKLVLFGLSGSELIHAGEALGLTVANEVFTDRTYQNDGSLTSRALPDAFVTDPSVAANRLARMVKEGKVRSRQGADLSIRAETACIHGDHPGALESARRVREVLEREGIRIAGVKAADGVFEETGRGSGWEI
jgi:UPF0271 protein